MMVGDPFSGKTKVLEVLAETLNLLSDRNYEDENVNKVNMPFNIQIDRERRRAFKSSKDLQSKQVHNDFPLLHPKGAVLIMASVIIHARSEFRQNYKPRFSRNNELLLKR